MSTDSDWLLALCLMGLVVFLAPGCEKDRQAYNAPLEAKQPCQHGFGKWGPVITSVQLIGGHPQYRYCTNCGIAEMRIAE